MLVWVTSTSGVSDASCRLDGESTTCVKASGGLTIAKDDRGPLSQASQLLALEGCKRSDALQPHNVETSRVHLNSISESFELSAHPHQVVPPSQSSILVFA